MPSPIAVELVLEDEKREQLESWARRGKSAQALARRSRIVLAAAEGLKNTRDLPAAFDRSHDGAQVALAVRRQDAAHPGAAMSALTPRATNSA